MTGLLADLRVLEIGDETGEYCGLTLAGLGAQVLKIEPPGGAPSRRIGPFAGDRPDKDRSLFFWHYNRGKQSVVVDLETDEGRAALVDLLANADVVVDSSGGALNASLGLDREKLLARFPNLVVARLTPFGDVGPWKDFKGSDLVHLALGGVCMNCGYDANPAGDFDMPPVAPQMWHALHIAGEQLMIGILGALLHRTRTGQGQEVSCAIHEAVSKSTELDLMNWVMRRATLYRQTCRHATETPNHVPSIMHTKDGRWYVASLVGARDEVNLVPFLARYGMAADLEMPDSGADLVSREIPGATPVNERKSHIFEVMQRFVRAWRNDETPWREAQEAGLLWAPLRKPHENLDDPHWRDRDTFSPIDHPEHGRSFLYPTSKWVSTATNWASGRRAPLLNEDANAKFDRRDHARPKTPAAGRETVSPHGLPFALQGVRILDFSWFLASAGGTRFVTALGAETLKVEWKANPDTRFGAMAPVGGRAAREKASAPLEGVADIEMGGQFLNKNPGKRGLSLNIRDPRGLEIAKRLLATCDVVAEGFSPGVLARNGLSYDVMKAIKPDIIYVSQSGMGAAGRYGRLRTVGPIAQAFTGLSEMSGMPEPTMPAGWGYSYLDWIGAYGFAQAILAALYHRDRTGEGQWIDASQCEAGLALGGTAYLDWQVNGRAWTRSGNRSPNKPAAPHGVYRCRGEDCWIAIACFDEQHWQALTAIANAPAWREDKRFATLESRLAHQDDLDALVSQWTSGLDRYDAMQRLQAQGVPAGVCQSAGDRCDSDPQLAALNWLTEVTGKRIGTWPIAEVPFRMSRTPGHVGGVKGAGAPIYGEDNEYVLSTILNFSVDEIKALAAEGVI